MLLGRIALGPVLHATDAQRVGLDDPAAPDHVVAGIDVPMPSVIEVRLGRGPESSGSALREKVPILLIASPAGVLDIEAEIATRHKEPWLTGRVAALQGLGGAFLSISLWIAVLVAAAALVARRRGPGAANSSPPGTGLSSAS